MTTIAIVAEREARASESGRPERNARADASLEYKSLRQEILQTLSQLTAMGTLAVTASAVILGAAFQIKNPIVALLPLPLIVVCNGLVLNYSQAIGRIATYLRIFHESDNASQRWEIRLGLFRIEADKLYPVRKRPLFWVFPRHLAKEVWLAPLIERALVVVGWGCIAVYGWMGWVLLGNWSEFEKSPAASLLMPRYISNLWALIIVGDQPSLCGPRSAFISLEQSGTRKSWWNRWSGCGAPSRIENSVKARSGSVLSSEGGSGLTKVFSNFPD
jgi:hypothetical protein